MFTKRYNALFGRYPSCDLLSNAIRFIRNGKIDAAVMEIIFAIEKADGYFHEDNADFVSKARTQWAENHKT